LAGYDRFDPRLETLVRELRTIWPAEFHALSPEEKQRHDVMLQAAPALAAHVHYERIPTGFIREITVTQADLNRIQAQAVSATDHSAETS
jgi:hypothetical protein